MNKMYKYLMEHNYISNNEDKSPFIQQELSKERAICIANKYEGFVKELQEENKALNGILETQRKRKYCSKFLKDFQKENGKNVFPDFDEIYKRYDDYKERISKALEYIEARLNIEKEPTYCEELITSGELKHLLEILKGEESKEKHGNFNN